MQQNIKKIKQMHNLGALLFYKQVLYYYYYYYYYQKSIKNYKTLESYL